MAAPPNANASRRHAREELFRFLAVGAWNTAFGYGTFAGFNWLLTDVIPYPYLAANVLSNVVAISVAFLLYKLFVFRTQGNGLAEFVKMNLVYFSIALIGLVLLPLMVRLAAFAVPAAAAPYAGQAILVPLAALASYVGHQRISFARGKDGEHP